MTMAAAAPELKRRKVYHIPATEDDFKRAGSEIMRRDPEGRTNTKTFQRRWMALFGVTPLTCFRVWELLRIYPDDPLYKGVKHCHLLWCLLFLRLYGAEEEAATLCGGVDEGTFRRWSQLFIERIAAAICDVIIFENRYKLDKSMKMRTFVRRRQETVNKRMKQFKVLSTVFRHDLELHGDCFRAVAVLTQLEIDHGARLFDVPYTDDYYFELMQSELAIGVCC